MLVEQQRQHEPGPEAGDVAADVRQAPDPQWHYSIISLKYDPPRLRNFRIVEGAISETALIRD